MSSSPDKGDEGRLLIGKVHDAVEEHYFGPLSVGEALEKIRGLVAFTPSTTPHNVPPAVSFDKWWEEQTADAFIMPSKAIKSWAFNAWRAAAESAPSATAHKCPRCGHPDRMLSASEVSGCG